MVETVEGCIDTKDVGAGLQRFETDNLLGLKDLGEGNSMITKVATDVENREAFREDLG